MSQVPSSPPPLYGEVVPTDARELESNRSAAHPRYKERKPTQQEDQNKRLKNPKASGQLDRKEGMLEKRKKHTSRPKPPDLNIVTDFSKPSTKFNKLERTATREAQMRPKKAAQSKEWSEKKPPKRDLMKGPIGSLKANENPLSGVSPSDRFLVIGLSVPSSNVANHVSSPESTIIQPQGLQAKPHVEQHAVSPLTPEIVITPARAGPPLPKFPTRLAPPPTRRRATSSVYSVATQYARGVSVMGQVPHGPIPPLPSTRYNGPQPVPGVSPRRQIVSTDTVFDEDADGDASPTQRPYSGESQVGILRRGSVDSVATRHRSRGWWNEKILSPLLQRSNTGMTRVSPTDSIQQRQSIGLGRSRSLSAADHGLSGIHERIISPVGPAMTDSKFEPFSGIGLAAEYYEACWHDQNSPTPFFPCIGHDCSAPRFLPGPPLANGSRGAETPEMPFNDGHEHHEAFHQKPANRFSAAFAEARGANPRPGSNVTDIEEDPETTPEVQEARAAPVVKAEKSPVIPLSRVSPKERGVDGDGNGQRAFPEAPRSCNDSVPVQIRSPPTALSGQSRGMVAATPERFNQAERFEPQAYSTPRRLRTPPSIPTLENQSFGGQAAHTPRQKAELQSPQPAAPTRPSPERTKSNLEATPMASQPRAIGTPQQNNTYYVNQYYPERPRDHETKAAYVDQSFPPPPGPALDNSEEKQSVPRTGTKRHKSKKHHRSKSGSSARLKEEQKRKKRRCYFCIVLALIALIALILSLTLTLTRHHTDIPVQSNWLNLTGFPPIPTGISTIARPDAHSEISGCVQPPTMWSCAVSKEQQQALLPNDPDQPNFRLEIRFQNGTFPANETEIIPSKLKTRSRLYSPRSLFSRQSSLFSPNPAPPSVEDQTFLGNTTDNNTAPFAGEATPFFISFLPTSNPSAYNKALQTRQSSDPFPNITDPIPAPALNPDGTAAAANLLPFPSAQPLRLYNRGRSDEHYGFYTYYDRRIFLRSTDLVNDSENATSVAEVPADLNGGAEESAATVVCTWRQTRFLVQIWTNPQGAGPLLSPLSGENATSTATATATVSAATPTASSSATTFSRPGSFQLPVSIILDRHGGDVHEKEIFCYRVDTTEHVQLDQKKLQLEDRAFGGPGLVNPSQGAFGSVSLDGFGGIDGGQGGCGCEWRNWGA